MELVGIDNILNVIEDFINSFGKTPTTALVLLGPPGCGKTSSVYYVAKKLGYEVCEYNMSDDRNEEFLDSLVTKTKCKTLQKIIFLLDEVDGIEIGVQKIIERMIMVTKNPIILTANDRNKLSPLLREEKAGVGNIKVIRFYKPNIRDVLSVVKRYEKEKGLKANNSGIVEDFRQGIMCVYGSQGYEESRYWEVVGDLLRSGKIDDIDVPRLIYLLDNVGKHFSGIKLFDAIQRIVIADKTKTHYPLVGLKSRKKELEKSYYFEKMKVRR